MSDPLELQTMVSGHIGAGSGFSGRPSRALTAEASLQPFYIQFCEISMAELLVPIH